LPFQPKKKNNHFVPRSYLQRFCSISERQIGFYNIKSGLIREDAPIRSQCSRDYFYTKNPLFEDEFGKIEGAQTALLKKIIDSQGMPEHGSADRRSLSSLVMFQAGRTAATAAHVNHLIDQFGKAALRHHLTKKGDADLLELLPKVKISKTNAVMDAIGQHLAMSPLIDDLDGTLLFNDTEENFLTSDHPVVLCNSMPAIRPCDRGTGFSSRGLIILYPISPRALIFFCDAEVYRIEKNSVGCSLLERKRDVLELNLKQFGNAHENVYFSSSADVQETLGTFRKKPEEVRPPRANVEETPVISEGNRRGILLTIVPQVKRLPLPKVAQLRYAARTGKYKIGDGRVRDPLRAYYVEEELNRLEAMGKAAMKKAQKEEPEEVPAS
jgi:hypothetical protein